LHFATEIKEGQVGQYSKSNNKKGSEERTIDDCLPFETPVESQVEITVDLFDLRSTGSFTSARKVVFKVALRRFLAIAIRKGER
jgi:hypothetical protein